MNYLTQNNNISSLSFYIYVTLHRDDAITSCSSISVKKNKRRYAKLIDSFELKRQRQNIYTGDISALYALTLGYVLPNKDKVGKHFEFNITNNKGGTSLNKVKTISTYKDGYKDGDEISYLCGRKYIDGPVDKRSIDKKFIDKRPKDVMRRLIEVQDLKLLSNADQYIFFNGDKDVISTKKVYKDLGKNMVLTSYQYNKKGPPSKHVVIKKEGDYFNIKVYPFRRNNPFRRSKSLSYDIITLQYQYTDFFFKICDKTRIYETAVGKDDKKIKYLTYEGDLVDGCTNLDGEETRWALKVDDEKNIKYHISSIHRYDRKNEVGSLRNYKDGVFDHKSVYFGGPHKMNDTIVKTWIEEHHYIIMSLLKTMI
jgi:hypothetical protein